MPSIGVIYYGMSKWQYRRSINVMNTTQILLLLMDVGVKANSDIYKDLKIKLLEEELKIYKTKLKVARKIRR